MIGPLIQQDLQYDANRGPLNADDNWITGSLESFQNRGGLTIAANRINGNLQCKENNPPPGGGNVVQGNQEDQRAGL